MQIVLDNCLRVGWTVGKWAPPQLAAAFFVKGTFNLLHGKTATPSDKPEIVCGDVAATQAEQSSLRYASDFAPMKVRADVLVAGTAYTPEGKPATAVRAGFGLGPADKKSILEKRLTITGPRVWNKGLLTSKPGEPQPFLSLPLIYENAFGGAGVPTNPVGKGVGDLMPQIELEGAPVLSPRDKHAPAGFAPLHPTWHPRNHKLGHYDGAWLKERWPWLPKDFNWEHFNAAPRDQQVDGYLRGDETIYFQNMHKQHAHYSSALPGLRVRLFVQDRHKDASRFREVPVKLDTLWADMDAEKLVLVWRGQAEVQTLKARELEYVFAVVEPLAETPKPMSYWQAELARRMAQPAPPAPEVKEREKDPTPTVGALMQEMDPLMTEMHKQEAVMDAHLANNIKQLQARNLPTTGMSTKPPYGPQSLAEVPAFLKQMETLANANQAAHLAQLASSGKAAAFKLPAEMTQPIRIELPPELAKAAQIQQQAGRVPAAAPPQPDDNIWTRERVLAHAKAGKPFARVRLGAVDLSGVDLSGANLAFVRLNNVKLAGANLSGADMTGAECGAGNFAGAKLVRCNLHGATFTGAVLAGADLSEARLDDTNFVKADLAKAKLAGARGYGTYLAEANLAEINGAGVNIEGGNFTGAMAEKANFKGSRLIGCGFMQANAKGADFSGSDLANFRGQRGNFEETKFARCKLGNSAWTEANLKRADFTHADLPNSLFDFVVLEGALLGAADATASNFADSNLKAAKFAVANGMRCSFDRSDLSLVDFQGANLYCAEFWDAVTVGADFRNANVARTTLSK
ncbi:MAG: DUF2169 domain-containing protein [Planctomycetes bacterium]|nr:DUF2169 domain-containing protein [Planctomycetota bacterium]